MVIFRQAEPIVALRTVTFRLKASDGVTNFTGALSGADVQLSKAGSALANAAGVATHLSNGLYKLVLDVADLDTPGEIELEIAKTGVQGLGYVLGTVERRFFATVAAGATVTAFPTNRTEAADFWKDLLVTAITGACTGQTKKVGGFATTGGVFTMATGEAFTTALANGDIVEILSR